jgi:hypothetical protein
VSTSIGSFNVDTFSTPENVRWTQQQKTTLGLTTSGALAATDDVFSATLSSEKSFAARPPSNKVRISVAINGRVLLVPMLLEDKVLFKR